MYIFVYSVHLPYIFLCSLTVMVNAAASFQVRNQDYAYFYPEEVMKTKTYEMYYRYNVLHMTSGNMHLIMLG